jgi:hypothetical protein
MTISSTTNRVSYTGNGVTTAFSFPYKFFAQADLVVIETVIATGVQTTKALTTDYTISGTADSSGVYQSGGTVNAVTAPANTVTWTIYRDPALTQTVEHVDNDPVPAASIDNPLDKLTAVEQRTREMVTRGLRQPDGDTTDIGVLPAKVKRASKYLAFDASGDPLAADGSADATPISTFMATVVDDPDAATARATLGLVVGTDVQAHDADLDAIAALAHSAGRVPMSSGSAWSSYDYLVGRNRLINPAGSIYQSDVAATADDTYFADDWYVLSQTGSVTPSVLTDPEDGYPKGIRLTQSQASAQRFGYAQIVEGKNCKDLRGKSGVFVPRIRASASQAIRYAILGWTGTEDSVTSDVVNDWTSATYTAGNFFLASNVSVLAIGSATPAANTWTSLAAISGALGSSFNNLIGMVWTEGTAAQNFTLDFDFNQLEAGTIPTAFERRPYQTEFSFCRRYYRRWNQSANSPWPITVGFARTTTAVKLAIPLDTPMRATPTVGFSHIAFNDGAGSFTCSAGTNMSSADVVAYQFAVTGATAGKPGDVGSDGNACYIEAQAYL